MKERRASPRDRCPIALTWRILDDNAYRELMETFESKRNRVVLYDQLEYKNTLVSRHLKHLDNGLADILENLNDQLNVLARTLAMDFDALQEQQRSDVIINLGGMLLQTEKALPPGRVIELQLKLAPEIPRLLIVAEALRSQAITGKKYTTAISFTYIQPEDKAVLREFVERRLKQEHSDKKAV